MEPERRPEPEPAPEPKPSSDAQDWDLLDEASWESFPASDSPAVSAEALERTSEAPRFEAGEQRALRTALDRAYQACAAVDQLIRSLGADPELLELRSSQARQIDELEDMFLRFGMQVPDNAWADRTAGATSGTVTVDATIDAAIEAAEAAASAYEALANSTDRGDALTVYRELCRVAIEEHLPTLAKRRGGASK